MRDNARTMIEGLADRIDQRLQAVGMNARAASLAADLAADFIRNIQRGKSREPGAEALWKLSKPLKCNLEWLISGEGDEEKESITNGLREDFIPFEVQTSIYNSLASGMVSVCGVEYAAVPRFDASLSAGRGCIIHEEPHPMGHALFENQWLRAVTAAPPTALALLRVDGESMMPTLNDGDWVLIDRQQRSPAKEGIYALAVDDAAWVKRLSVNKPAGTVIIESDNKLWKTQEWPADTVNLIGRVIWLFGRKIV